MLTKEVCPICGKGMLEVYSAFDNTGMQLTRYAGCSNWLMCTSKVSKYGNCTNDYEAIDEWKFTNNIGDGQRESRVYEPANKPIDAHSKEISMKCNYSTMEMVKEFDKYLNTEYKYLTIAGHEFNAAEILRIISPDIYDEEFDNWLELIVNEGFFQKVVTEHDETLYRR